MGVLHLVALKLKRDKKEVSFYYYDQKISNQPKYKDCEHTFRLILTNKIVNRHTHTQAQRKKSSGFECGIS